MGRLLQLLALVGLSRGFRNGSRVWITIGVTAQGLRLLGKLAGRAPKVVYREDLVVGETLLIRHLPREGG